MAIATNVGARTGKARLGMAGRGKGYSVAVCIFEEDAFRYDVPAGLGKARPGVAGSGEVWQGL